MAGGTVLVEVIAEKHFGGALTSSFPFLKLLGLTASFAVVQVRAAR